MILRGMRAVADLILPRVCVVCGRKLLLEERHICLYCLSDMPFTYFWNLRCNNMADSLNGLLESKGQSEHERYAYAAALFYYHSEADYRHIPYQIKYHGNIDAGRFFGKMLGKRLSDSKLFSDADAIIPVPLHWTRKWKRGYNQAEVIAYGIAEEMGVPVLTDILKRYRRTQTQTKLDIEGKSRNVHNAFKVHKCPPAGLRHVILVDDVFTTGSTLFACFTALRSVFPPSVRISAATLAFVGEV